MKGTDKKTALDIPFTQLWQSFSRECQKQNIAPHKYNKCRQQSKQVHAYKSIQDDILHKRRGFSLNNIHKKNNDIHASNSILKSITSQIITQEDIESFNLGNNQSDSHNKLTNNSHNKNTHNRSLFNNSCVNHKSQRNKSINSIKSVNSESQKTSKKIMKVISLHFIPFIVDKFVELQQQISHKIHTIQQIVDQQQRQIKSLKSRQHKYQLDAQQYRKIIQSEIKFVNTKTKNAQTLNKNQPMDLIQQNRNSLISRVEQLEQNPKYEQLNKRTSKMQEQLMLIKQKTDRMRQSLGFDQKIGEVCLKIKEMELKQQQKYEQQLSHKMLELITTYNTNFIDVDKRIYDIEQAISDDQGSHHNLKSKDGPFKKQISL